ncbi:MAG TPA: hypothetical protein VI306_24115 [Pyrinomonadaceae bacterium]
MKRRRAHEREPYLARPEPSFLFHPAFYFLSKLIFLIAGAGFVVDIFYPDDAPEGADYFGLPPKLFFALFLGVPAVAILSTAIVYFYFWKPKHKAIFKVLETPQCEAVADLFLFVNMLGYQMFWARLMNDLTTDFRSIVGRLAMFGFSALLIYFPPRLFYLAEDGDRPITWLMILIANSPVLVRILIK